MDRQRAWQQLLINKLCRIKYKEGKAYLVMERLAFCSVDGPYVVCVGYFCVFDGVSEVP